MFIARDLRSIGTVAAIKVLNSVGMLATIQY